LQATELGFGVWCDSRLKLSHIGETGYNAEEYFKKKKKNVQK